MLQAAGIRLYAFMVDLAATIYTQPKGGPFTPPPLSMPPADVASVWKILCVFLCPQRHNSKCIEGNHLLIPFPFPFPFPVLGDALSVQFESEEAKLGVDVDDILTRSSLK